LAANDSTEDGCLKAITQSLDTVVKLQHQLDAQLNVLPDAAVKEALQNMPTTLATVAYSGGLVGIKTLCRPM